jgi:hypothetical protein
MIQVTPHMRVLVAVAPADSLMIPLPVVMSEEFTHGRS